MGNTSIHTITYMYFARVLSLFAMFNINLSVCQSHHPAYDANWFLGASTTLANVISLHQFQIAFVLS